VTDTTVTGAVVVREQTGPAAMVETYRDEYAALMPSHLNPDQWVRMAVGAIRGDDNLVQAASNDIGVFLRELRTAARLGLEPGTEQFYLTPRKVKGRKVIKGIAVTRGYRTDLPGRRCSAVIVESSVRRPVPSTCPAATSAPSTRSTGTARTVNCGWWAYAYAVMKDGATSKVVVLNKGHIAKARAKSGNADKDSSVWNTDTEAMWLKTAAHRLTKWVPTSAEYMRERMRSQAQIDAEQRPAPTEIPAPPAGKAVDSPDGEHEDEDDGETVEAEFVDDEPSAGWPETAAPGSGARR
jgi:recombination protein RecT